MKLRQRSKIGRLEAREDSPSRNLPLYSRPVPQRWKFAAASSDGENVGASWDDEAATPALESLLLLLATMIARFGRGSSDKFTLISIYLSSFESSSNNSQINIVVAAGFG